MLNLVSNVKGDARDGQTSVLSFKFQSKKSTNVSCPPD